MKFNELTDSQKAKALDKYRYAETSSNDWYQDIKCEFEEMLESIGFKDVESAFTGFCSQGDGASFVCDSIDIKMFLNHLGKWNYYTEFHEGIESGEITAKIERSTIQYVHDNTIFVEMGSNHIDRLAAEILEYARLESYKYYKRLNEYSDALESDESVQAYIEGNEIEFEVQKPGVTYL